MAGRTRYAPRMPISGQRVSIVVPARNEAETIVDVLNAVRSYGDELIVVDGRSSDATASLARDAGALVVPDNGRGKGDAVRCGARAAKGDLIVFIDADGSHEPTDVPKLLAPLASGEADLVIGSRMRGGSDELHSNVGEAVRLMGSTVITQAINLRFGVHLTDYQNGFRAIRAKVFWDLGLTEDITTIEQEMAIKALRLGYRVAEIPSHEFVRKGGQSKINVMRDSHKYIFQLVRELSRRSPRRG